MCNFKHYLYNTFCNNSSILECPDVICLEKGCFNFYSYSLIGIAFLIDENVFVFFSVLEISVFSMVSKEITRYIADYISTVAWKNKMILQSFHHSSRIEQKSTTGHYRDLGISVFCFL